MISYRLLAGSLKGFAESELRIRKLLLYKKMRDIYSTNI